MHINIEKINKFTLYTFLGGFINKFSDENKRRLSVLMSKLIIILFHTIIQDNIKINYEHLYPYFKREDKEKYFRWKIYAFHVLSNYIFEQLVIMTIPFRGIEEYKKHPLFKKLSERKYLFDNGGILVSSHLSAWEMAVIIIGMVFKDRVMSVVESKNIDEKTYAFFERIRTLSGMRVLPVESAQREMLKHLKNNGILLVVGDRDILKSGWKVEFFGEEALLPSGALTLSYTTRKDIMIGYLFRDKDNLLNGDIIGVLPYVKDKKSLKTTFLKEYARWIEKTILKTPTEWFVFYPVWSDA